MCLILDSVRKRYISSVSRKLESAFQWKGKITMKFINRFDDCILLIIATST